MSGFLSALLLSGSASAVTWSGGDWGGADLLLADGDVLSGTFTNVGAFYVPNGATVYVETRVPLLVYADRVVVDGTIDGLGAGEAGGQGQNPIFGAPADGQDGSGLGPGGRGAGGACTHGGGGGGGANGGQGGQGGYLTSTSFTGYPVPATGGLPYGFAGDTGTPLLGSGAGSGGTGCTDPSADGGAGGGAVRIEARYVSIDGLLDVRGEDGADGIGNGGGPGGGGGGGTAIVVTDLIDGRGDVDAKGGIGGDGTASSGGGGGGGGGRITIHYARVVSLLPSTRTQFGTGGLDAGGMFYPARNGLAGAAIVSLVDADGDGITDVHDEFGCGGADADGDSVCDAWDVCPGADDRVDADLDGAPDACDGCPADTDPLQLDEDGDGATSGCDCDDLDPAWSVFVTVYRDLDGDGDGDPAFQQVECAPPAGTSLSGTDCDDLDATVSGLATELCDGIDNDCDLAVDEPGAADAIPSFRDGDTDGWGDDATEVLECTVPPGNVTTGGDCDDLDPAVNPAATEVCNGIDDDCSGDVDSDAIDVIVWYRDSDRDGVGGATTITQCGSPGATWVTVGGDCDDGDPGVLGPATWYTDADGDGRGDPATGVALCTQPANTVANGDDCDDLDPALPTALWEDDDGDGHGDPSAFLGNGCPGPGAAPDALDCDDADPAVSPDATEVCNGLDDDCDGTLDGPGAADAADWYPDDDGDGWGEDGVSVRDCVAPDPSDVTQGGDCDDRDPAVNPDATEVCNGVDDDCDGATDGAGATDATDWYPDADSDGWGDDAGGYTDCDPQAASHVDRGGDCDDGNPDANPDGTEVGGNGVDEDCDGADGVGLDTDGDGLSDVAEAALGTDPTLPDSDGDGLDDGVEAPDGTGEDHDADGLIDPLDDDDDGDGLLTIVESGTDFDGDGTPNHLDLDSDGDGALDVAEGLGGFLDAGGHGTAERPPDRPSKYGCGCATQVASPFVALLLIPLLARRRR